MAARVTETECIEVSRHRRTYEVNFFGTTITTTVTSTPSVMRRWLFGAIYRLRRRGFNPSVVGMGVQWRPSGNDYAATLQICIGRLCLIIQLFRTDTVPNILRRFLLDESYTFVGFWNYCDAWRLEKCEHGLEMARRPLDMRLFVEKKDGRSLRRASFETIVEECLGYRGVGLDRAICMSNWEDYVLSEDQVSQATVDAYVAFLMGTRSELVSDSSSSR